MIVKIAKIDHREIKSGYRWITLFYVWWSYIARDFFYTFKSEIKFTPDFQVFFKWLKYSPIKYLNVYIAVEFVAQLNCKVSSV